LTTSGLGSAYFTLLEARGAGASILSMRDGVRLATFSGGGCRRIFAADGRRRGGHFRDVENPPARAD